MYLHPCLEKQSAVCEGRYQPKEPYDRARLLALGNVADVKDGTMPDYNLVALLDEHKDDMIGMYLDNCDLCFPFLYSCDFSS